MLGDLMLDVVLAPARALESGTDVPGRVSLVQGGSAATTARWLGRLGARSSLIASVGRDAAGRALVEALRSDGVTPRVVRVAGARTGRIGVARRARRRAQLRRRPWRGRPAPAGRPAGLVVQGGGCPPPAGLLAARRAARGCRPPRDRAGARGRRGRQRRSRLDRAAARRRPSLGTGADRGGRPGPPVRDGLRGRGAARRPAGRRAARVRGDGRGQARVEGRDGPGTGRRRAAPGSRWPPSTSPQPTRPARATPSTPGSSSAGSRPVPPGDRCRRRSSARPWPVIGRRRVSCRRRGRSCRSPDGLPRAWRTSVRGAPSRSAPTSRTSPYRLAI